MVVNVEFQKNGIKSQNNLKQNKHREILCLEIRHRIEEILNISN
jgi:hypothetical protein